MRAFEASWLEGPRRPKADPCLIIHSVGASAALLLYRIARPRGQFLGRVRIHADVEGTTAPLSSRDVYVPRQPDGIRNPNIRVDAPPPGVIIYRFDEAFVSSLFSKSISAA